MKRITILWVFALLVITSCKQKQKEVVPEESGTEMESAWTEVDRVSFKSNCEGFLMAEGVSDTETYCDCLLESSMEKYPDIDKAMELEQTQIVSMFEESDCIDELLLTKIDHPWTSEAEALFLEGCMAGRIKQGMSDADATSYCECALTEVRQLIPNPQHVISLTEEELSQISSKCQ